MVSPWRSARGDLPAAVDAGPANIHESRLVQGLFGFMLPVALPERIIGDKAYDSDALDEALAAQGIEQIAPHRCNRRPENVTQDGRPRRRSKRRWTAERTTAWLQHFRRLCIRWELHDSVQRLCASWLRVSVACRGFGIVSSAVG